MSFDINGKVALISGGASGIGFAFAQELLRNGLKGVTIVDIDDEQGGKALQAIKDEFGSEKATFVRADVTNMQSYEEAFKKTTDIFGNLDIVINNAGIFNDAMWEKEIATNINGTIHGTLLGLENYLPKYKSGSEGVIVNISSIAGVNGYCSVPIYTATKFAVVGMSISFGGEVHYNRTKVKVIALCPGGTDTPLMASKSGKYIGPVYEAIQTTRAKNLPPLQKPESVANALVKIVKNAKTGTVWVAQNGEDPYEFKIPVKESSVPQ